MNIISDKEYQESALCAKEQAKVQELHIVKDVITTRANTIQ